MFGPTSSATRRPHSASRMLLPVALATATVLLAACGGSDDKASTTTSATTGAAAQNGTPKLGGTLKVSRSVAPTQLDPAKSIIAGDVYTLDKIFEPLFATDVSGKLVPWLATGSEASTDKLTWTFPLRSGVTFSDGSPLTADDVVFSLLRAKNTKDGPLSFLDSPIKGVTAKDPHTVVVTLSQPWAPFLSDISLFTNAIIPKDFGGKSEKEFFAHPIGTGPFTLDSFTPGAPNLTLKKNPHYWQSGKPYLDGVDFSYVNDDNQRVLQLKGGQADVIDNVPPAQVSQLTSDKQLAVTKAPAWQADLLVFNEKLPQFADPHVRRAISYAIDRQGIAKATTFGTSEPGGSFFPPSLTFYDKSTPVLQNDPEKAKTELAQSKYPTGFSTKILVPGGNEKWKAMAQIIQQELKPLGIDVQITALDDAAYHQAFQSFKYDMFIDYAINDISDADEMASFELDYKSGGSSSYWSSYDNSAVTELVHQAEKEFDTTKRAAIYSQIQAKVAQDVPFVALDYPPYLYAAGSKVHGLGINPGGAYRLEDVWLQ